MDMERGDAPWERIHEFLFDCGGIRNPRELSEEVVKKIDRLIPFDQARVYYVDYSGNLCDEYLLNVNKKWSSLYREYYSKVENGKYALLANLNKNISHVALPPVEECIHDWTNAQPSEYITDYLKPQGLKYSFGFGLFDAYDTLKCGISLDRTGSVKFTGTEIEIMYYIRTHIDNLHRNLFATVPIDKINAGTGGGVPLSQREFEIAGLIKNGMSTETISKKLFLSKKTVYRHVANIFAKMNISSRRELVMKLNECRGDYDK